MKIYEGENYRFYNTSCFNLSHCADESKKKANQPWKESM